MQVSDIEKKPSTARIAATVANSHPRSMSSVTPGASAALEDQFEDDLTADVGEQQEGESRERPVHRLAAAPAAEVVADQQAAEDEPGGDAEHGLVREGEGLAEQLLGEEDAAHQREREQHEGRKQDAEQQGFHLEERRQAAQERRQHAAMQPF